MNRTRTLAPGPLFAVLFAAAGLFVTSAARAASGAWNVNALGNWSTASNWNPAAVPGTATGDVVSLTYNITAARTVTIDGGTRLVGTLTIGDPTSTFYAYTLAASGGGSLSFNNGGLGANLVQPATTASDLLSAPIGLADNLSVSNKSNLTLSGAISGAGKSITKTGNGTLTLAGANIFSGGVTLSSGKLTLASATALGAAAGRLTLDGGTLDSSAPNLVIANNNPVTFNSDFTFAGTQNLNLGSGGVSLGSAAGSRTVTVSANVLTLGGVVSNGVATGLVKAGSGTLNLSGANTYTGGSTVSAGTLTFLNAAAQPASGTTAVAAGAALGLGVGGAGFFGAADVDALFADTLAGVSMNAAARVGVDTTAGSFTYGSSASGTRGLTKLGGNTLVLAGANTYSGVTTINGGVLQLDHAAALPGGTGAAGGTSALTFNGGVLALGAGDFTRALGAAGAAAAANFTSHGGWAATGADRIVNLGGNLTPAAIAWATANTGFNGKYLLLGAPTATHLVDVQNPLDLGTGTRTVVVSGGAAAVDAQLSGVLSGGSGGNLNIVGGGTLALTAANTYVGSTTVQSNSTLLVTGTGSISSTNALSVGANSSPGTVQYQSSAASVFSAMTVGQTGSAHGTVNQTAGDISVTGNVQLATSNSGYGTYNLSGGSLAVGLALNVGLRGPLAGTFTVSGSGALTATAINVAEFSSGAPCVGQLTLSGGTATAGALTLARTSSDANYHRGTVDLNGGTLNTGSILGGVATGGGSNTSTFNFNGGTLKPAAGSAEFMQGLTAATVKDGGAVIDTGGYDITIAQALLHAAGATDAPLTKNGAGTLTLSGANTFAGPVTVTGGTLLLTGSNLPARPITLAGGTLALGGSAQLSLGTCAAAITNNGALVFDSSASQTLSGVLSGAGTLTLTGAGTLALAGTNTLSGATAVTAGRLVGVAGGSLSASDVTVASGAVLGVKITASEGQWSCKSLTLGSGATDLEFRFYGASPSATTAPLLVSGDLVNSGTLNVTLGGVGLEAGTYPLIRYTGALTVGTLGAATLPGGGAGSLVNNTDDGTIDLQVTTASTPLVWNGGTGDWDIGGTANWAGGLTYSEGDLVRFDDSSSGAAPFTVTLAGNVSPGHVSVANPAKDYTFAGPGALSGETALTKSGAGALTLSGANTYSGGTTLGDSAGTVRATVSAGASGIGTGPAAIGSGSTLLLDCVNTAAVSVTQANLLSGTGTLKLTFAADATARATALPGLTGFAGTVQVGDAGSGTGDKLDASGAAAPAAAVQVADGHTLLVGTDVASASFGGIAVSGAGNAEGRGAIRLAASAGTLGGPVTLLGDTTIASDLASATLSGPVAGTAAAGATNVLTQGTASSGAGCVLSGALGDGPNGGRLALVQNRGVLTLTGANTHSGGTFVMGGSSLQIGATDTLPTASTLVLGGTNGSGGLAMGAYSQTVSTFAVSSTNGAWINGVAIGAGQTLAVTGAGGLTVGIDPGTNSSAVCRMSGAGALVVDSPAANVVVGRATPVQSYQNTGALDLSGLASVTLGSSGVGINEIRVGYGQDSSGTLTLSNTNNLINALAVTVGHSVGGGNPGVTGTGGLAGTLFLGAGENVFAVNTLNVALSKASGSVRFASQASGSPGTVTIGGRTRETAEIFIGYKTGTGTATTPTGTLDLRGHTADVAAGTVTVGRENGLNTYTSGTTGSLYFNAGTFTATNLSLAAKSGFSTGSATATLTVSGGVFTVTEGGLCTLASQTGWGSATAALNLLGGTFRCHADILSGPTNCTGTITLNGGTLDMAGHAIGLASQTVRVFNARSGTLMNLGEFNAGASPLLKTGPGTLVLDGTNTFTGATVVSNGTLRLATTRCLSPSTDVHLYTEAACQLDYSGRIAVHALYLDGVLQKRGIYGAGSLPAFLSGTGALETLWPPPSGTVLELR